MAVWPPPSPLPENRTNATDQEDLHPADHNDLASAINGLTSFLDYVQATAPTTPTTGQFWLKSDVSKLLYWTGAQWVEISWGSTLDESMYFGYRFVERVLFVDNGTFSKATYSWLRAIKVICIAAGGGGGGVLSQASRTAVGQSGSGGGYADAFITDIAGLAASVTITRGTGGAGGAAGNNAGGNGGNSSFGSLVISLGGLGGAGGDASGFFGATAIQFAGQGPQLGAFTGDAAFNGGASFFGVTQGSNYATSGNGGTSALGYGSGGVGVSGISSSSNGNVGRNRGGGGSGAAGGNHATDRSGGAGANGIVIVELYA